MIKKTDFYYDLPTELIAQTPQDKRDQARLLVFDKATGRIQHRHFFDILDCLREGDVLVVNDTRVLPAKLFGTTQSGKMVEVLLHKRLQESVWEVLIKNAKRYKAGVKIDFGEQLKGEFLDARSNGNCTMLFFYSGVFEEVLDAVGVMPLPHYIKPKLLDKGRYQTVYAQKNGSSVAAPTAGLHFTTQLIDKIKQKGVELVQVNLTVGLGTFRPVKADNIAEHQMHSEYFELDQKAADTINIAKSQGRRIIAVGTTSVRVLESSVDQFGKLVPQKTDTQIFIYPPYDFKIVDCMITNFHLPESTLIMLVSAFMGHQNTMEAYKLAVQERYRFFSFGDAMFIVNQFD